MNHNLTSHVLLAELSDVCGLDRKFTKNRNNFEVLKIGNFLYVDKETIVDPLLALDAEQCLDMKRFYPLAELVHELGLSKKERVELIESEHSFQHYGVSLFIIPDVIFNRKVTDKERIINIITESEEEEGYETVARITSTFKIGEYS